MNRLEEIEQLDLAQPQQTDRAALFIAIDREEVLWLIDEVKRLRRELALYLGGE